MRELPMYEAGKGGEKRVENRTFTGEIVVSGRDLDRTSF